MSRYYCTFLISKSIYLYIWWDFGLWSRYFNVVKHGGVSWPIPTWRLGHMITVRWSSESNDSQPTRPLVTSDRSIILQYLPSALGMKDEQMSSERKKKKKKSISQKFLWNSMKVESGVFRQVDSNTSAFVDTSCVCVCVCVRRMKAATRKRGDTHK